MLAGLIGLRQATPKPLFWIALAAGIGLFALRLSSDAGWWTGHFVHSCRRVEARESVNLGLIPAIYGEDPSLDPRERPKP